MSQPQFSPCDLCGGGDYPPNVKVVVFEQASHPLDYTTENLSVCNRCEQMNRSGCNLWAVLCGGCGLMRCTYEDRDGTGYCCPDCRKSS